MSLAFHLRVEPSPAGSALIRAAHVVGVAGAALAGAYLQQQGATVAAALVIVWVVLAVRVSADRARRRAPLGWLSVDDAGRARWARAGADPVADPGAVPGADAARVPPGEPFVPAHWFRFGPVTWLGGRAGPRPVHLLLGADRSPDESWRRLSAWLHWLERGGAADGR